MWVIELLAGFFGGTTVGDTGPHIGGQNTREQNIVMAIGEIALPVLGFVLIMWGGLLEHPNVSLVWMPAAFTGITALLAVWLVGDAAWTVEATLLAGLASWMCCASAYLFAAFIGFYHTF
jgi:hypothetical protein